MIKNDRENIELLSNLELISENDSRLSMPSSFFDFDNPVFDPVDFANDIYSFMKKYDGLGISACQVGIPYRIMSIRIDGTGDVPPVLFNPKIVDICENNVIMKEGCLSYPLLFMNVKRPDKVRVRYQNCKGEVFTNTFIGMTARIFLHEYDHLEGITFLKKASSFEKNRALRKRMILKRKVKNESLGRSS